MKLTPILSGLVALLAASCSGKGNGPGDADAEEVLDAVDIEDMAEVEAVEDGPPTVDVDPAEPAALPVLTPCPDGWREVTDEDTGAVVCDPWPETGAADCADHEVHLPGTSGCARVGPACPGGDYADDLPTDRTIRYVLAGASSGGDGSITSPHGTLTDAVDAASPGDVIAVGKGTYDDCVTAGGSLTFWGACAAETIVTCSSPSETIGTIWTTETGVQIRNMTLGGQRPGVAAHDGGEIDLQNVVVLDATPLGVHVGDLSTVTGRDVVVRGTRSSSEGRYGTGIQVVDGSAVDLTRCALEDNQNAGLLAGYTATTVSLTDCVIRDTLPAPDDDSGHGIDVGQGPHVTLTRVVVQNNHMTGVVAHDPFTLVEMTDCVVSDTQPRMTNLTQGVGVNVHVDARITMERVLVEQSREIGVIVLRAATLTLTDVVVRDTLPREMDDMFGRGINSQSGSHVDGTRVLIARSREVGLFLSETTGSWTDLTIVDTTPRESDLDSGRGAQISDQCVVVIDRIALERNTDIGIMLADPGTRASISDLIVRDTHCEPTNERFGHGMQVAMGAEATVERALFQDNMEASVLVGGSGALLTMSHATIERTLEACCAATTCIDEGGGMGLVTIGGGEADVTRFVVTDNALCGVSLAHGADSTGTPFTVAGVMDLHTGIVSNQPIGANVQAEGFDFDRLTDGVLYFDNGTNLDTSVLPVPGTGL